jgi:hypothetical protein
MLAALLAFTVVVAAQSDPSDDAPASPAPPESAPSPPPESAPPESAPPAERAPATPESAPIAPASVSAPETVASATVLARDAFPACFALAHAGKRREASTCFAQAKRDDLAGLVSTLKLPEPELHVSSSPDLSELVRTGKAELVATSALAGAGIGLSEGFALLYAGAIGQTDFIGPAQVAPVLLAPVVGGAIGLATSASAVVLLPQLTAGDANAIRAFEMLGGFDAIMFTIDRQILVQNQSSASFDYTANSATTAFFAGGMIVVSTAAGVGVAALTDLPEGAGSFAISSALWTSVGAVLAVDAFQGFSTHPENVAWLITASGNIAFVGGLVASPFLDVTRGETWAMDLGGGVGLVGGAAIATFAHAPNPFIGWGTIFLGTAAGIGGGYAAAHFIPGALDHLPALIAVAPTNDGRGLVVAASGRF